MFIKNEVDLKTINPVIFETDNYLVIANSHAPEYDMEISVKFEGDKEPNYLVINKNTRAVEFAIDQLPTVMDVASKLDGNLKEVVENIRKAAFVKPTLAASN